ncbi:hypothetical protein [Sulfuricaulis sp.]|uniref:hypothetical protein n=1 Tax=Sulfuricaulis sp. TaxID=2003553 RepID=UPI0025E63863|nr:hypothetical protein [Sulfuricaulis sp.]
MHPVETGVKPWKAVVPEALVALVSPAGVATATGEVGVINRAVFLWAHPKLLQAVPIKAIKSRAMEFLAHLLIAVTKIPRVELPNPGLRAAAITNPNLKLLAAVNLNPRVNLPNLLAAMTPSQNLKINPIRNQAANQTKKRRVRPMRAVRAVLVVAHDPEAGLVAA